MPAEDRVYIELQRHIDKQAVGLPATPSKAELRIIKRVFTPRQAEIARHLSYRPESVQTIYPRVKTLVASPEELSGLLQDMQKNGAIGTVTKDGTRHYMIVPVMPGMIEMQVGRFTSEWVTDVRQLLLEKKYAVAILSTELPQTRTIPVATSITPKSRISTFDEVAVLVEQADPPVTVFDCVCRLEASRQGQKCKVTDRMETCVSFGTMAESVMSCGFGKVITRGEALSILDKSQKQGLVLQPSNTQKPEFICSCCGCCCFMLRAHHMLPKPLDYWASNFQSVVDTNTCDGCGVCETRCQVQAITVPRDTQIAVVDLTHCIGCGVCVSTCPKKAISLQMRSTETTPPKTREELYDIIMAKKKGALGTLGVQAKFIFDCVSTGQRHLLK
jgi:H+/Na+-translocating ferredoxin:NAD+ oxidoreductase subunit B